MELEELRPHWRSVRSSNHRTSLSEEALSELLPNERSLFQRVLLRASRHIGVFGFLLVCCHGC
ncbi:MAG: hypothetical protein WA958_03955 [Tunicatimonas sp.]